MTIELDRPIGRGGFGTVYKARLIGEGGFAKTVALKVLNPEVSAKGDVAVRLRDEARMLGLLRHRAIVHVDGLVMHEGAWAIIMEFLDGVDLRAVVETGAIPLGPALEIAGEVAGALDAAYGQEGPDGQPLRLLHRDIKPSNLHLTSRGEVKILDFGIARAEFATREAVTQDSRYGSLLYMSPERHDRVDGPEGDVYALGAVLFELLVGAPLGRGMLSPDRHSELLATQLATLPAGPDSGVGTLLRSMLAYDWNTRPSARDVEKQCAQLRLAAGPPLLRDWAEEVVPRLSPRIPSATPAPLGSSGSPASSSGKTSEATWSLSTVQPVEPSPVVPSPGVPPPPHPVRSSSSLALVAVAGLLVVVGLLLARPWLFPAASVAVVDTPAPVAVVAPPVQPVPPPMTPAVEPPVVTAPVEPAVVPPPATPAVVARPLVRPVPAVVTPVVPAPPAPPNPPVAPAPTGTPVALTGDALAVYLVGPGGRVAIPGAVTPGTYQIEASFPAHGTQGAGTVTVGSSPLSLNCSASFTRCAVAP